MHSTTRSKGQVLPSASEQQQASEVDRKQKRKEERDAKRAAEKIKKENSKSSTTPVKTPKHQEDYKSEHHKSKSLEDFKLNSHLDLSSSEEEAHTKPLSTPIATTSSSSSAPVIMSSARRHDKFQYEGDSSTLGIRFKNWLEELELFFRAEKAYFDTDEKKLDEFLYLIRGKCYEAYKLVKPDSENYKSAVDALKKKFIAKPIRMIEVDTFRQQGQMDGETVDQYVTRLRKFAEHCEFGGQLETELLQQLLAKGKSQALRKKLVEKLQLGEEVKLDTALNLAKAEETIKDNLATINKNNQNSVSADRTEVLPIQQQQSMTNNTPSFQSSGHSQQQTSSQPNQSNNSYNNNHHHQNNQHKSNKFAHNNYKQQQQPRQHQQNFNSQQQQGYSQKQHSGPKTSSANNNNCGNCGQDAHVNNAPCPARGQICSKCQKRNHLAPVCRSPAANINNNNSNSTQSGQNKNVTFGSTTVKAVQQYPSEDDFRSTFTIQRESVNKIGSDEEPPMIELHILNLSIQFLIDTGAQVNIIDFETYKQMPAAPQLHASKSPVCGYNKSKIENRGEFKATIEHKGKIVEADIRVVSGAGGCLLSYKTAKALGLVQIINSIEKEYASEFPQLFSDRIGKLKGVQIKLEVDPDIKPIQQKFRNTPFAL
jgi:hypothetical protein